MTNKDMPDVFYAEVDNSLGVDIVGYKTNFDGLTKCYSQSHIDELTRKHEAELKAIRRATIYECLDLLDDSFSYGRVFELLSAKVKDDE